MTPISANFVEKCRMIKYFSMNAHALTGSNPSCFRKKQTDIHLFLSGSPKSVSFLGKRSSNGAHEKTGLKPVFDSSVVCCDVWTMTFSNPLSLEMHLREKELNLYHFLLCLVINSFRSSKKLSYALYASDGSASNFSIWCTCISGKS